VFGGAPPRSELRTSGSSAPGRPASSVGSAGSEVLGRAFSDGLTDDVHVATFGSLVSPCLRLHARLPSHRGGCMVSTPCAVACLKGGRLAFCSGSTILPLHHGSPFIGGGAALRPAHGAGRMMGFLRDRSRRSVRVSGADGRAAERLRLGSFTGGGVTP
jgi:hypothetical protein